MSAKPRTKLTRNVREGESVVLDGGRVVMTLVKRYGRSARLVFDLEADIRVHHVATTDDGKVSVTTSPPVKAVA